MPAARSFLALLIVSLPIASGCVCAGTPKRDPVLEKAAFGDLVAPKETDLAPYLALARALVTHGDKPPAIAGSPGRRVMLTVFPQNAPRVVASGLGDTLEASVVAAAAALPPVGDGGATSVRVQLDVVTDVEPIALGDDTPESWGELGRSGFAIATDGAHVGYVLPSEILLEKDFEAGDKPLKLESGAIFATIETRGALKRTDGSTFRIHTRAVVDTANGSGALPLERGMVAGFPEVTPATLLESVRLGAEYLSRILDSKGRYIYRYRPTDDHTETSYGNLRHAGATYALLEAYDELRTPLYLQKAESALAYIEAHVKTVDDNGQKDSYFVDGNDEEQQKVGGAGLALVATAKEMELTGSKAHLESARSFARLIVRQQYPDGHFRANHDVEREGSSHSGAPLKKEVLYYPGEAILGLMRLYRVDPDPRWLEAATKGADYCVHVRDADVSEEAQEHDHWLSYAMNDLYRVTHDQAYIDHAYKIARSIIRKEKTPNDAPAPDFVGSFYAQAPTTPASTRLEAFAADIELSRFAKLPEAWLMTPATSVAKYMRAQQLDADRVFFARNPEKALGGVREGLFVEDVQIDYVQHAMSAWLHFARELRDPTYMGWKGP
jgi:Beta-L-arabinofuranosidase, GH127